MTFNEKVIIKQIDYVLDKWKSCRSRSKYDDFSDLPETETIELLTLLAATIDRLAPLGSRYRTNAHSALSKYGENNIYNIRYLVGIINALKTDCLSGHMKAVYELVHADIFSDFLEMAEYLLDEGYKDPAAVIIGGVLEEHLRKLSQKNKIPIKNGKRNAKADKLNADLANADVYSKLDQKSVMAWLDLRNKAAHSRYSEYTKEQVALMGQGVRDFISRYPA